VTRGDTTLTTTSGFPFDEQEQFAARGAWDTAREIGQQPELWREVVANATEQRAHVERFLAPLLADERLRIVLTGAGTSAFVAEVLAPALTRRLRRRIEAVATTDIVSNPREAFAEDVPTLLVSFARSGDSPESVAATDLADQCLRSVHHLVVTCNAEGTLAHRHEGRAESFVLLMPPRSHDRGFAMTSSFTCMVLATFLTLDPAGAGEECVETLARAGEELLARHESEIAALARRGFERVVYLGSGPLCGLARESALKLLELTAGGIDSYFESSLGFRHGPKSMLDDRTLAVVYVSNDPYTRRYDEDIADELRRTTGPEQVLEVTAHGGERSARPHVLRVPGAEGVADPLAAIVFVIVAQLFGLRASLALGRTPDNPFPSGEVNRVVRGVTVHALTEAQDGEG
jgi:tagatose-6-phosphate ketose/aldose isomerase